MQFRFHGEAFFSNGFKHRGRHFCSVVAAALRLTDDHDARIHRGFRREIATKTGLVADAFTGFEFVVIELSGTCFACYLEVGGTDAFGGTAAHHFFQQFLGTSDGAAGRDASLHDCGAKFLDDIAIALGALYNVGLHHPAIVGDCIVKSKQLQGRQQ